MHEPKNEGAMQTNKLMHMRAYAHTHTHTHTKRHTKKMPVHASPNRLETHIHTYTHTHTTQTHIHSHTHSELIAKITRKHREQASETLKNMKSGLALPGYFSNSAQTYKLENASLFVECVLQT